MYQWTVFLHVFFAFAFMLAHGVQAAARIKPIDRTTQSLCRRTINAHLCAGDFVVRDESANGLGIFASERNEPIPLDFCVAN